MGRNNVVGAWGEAVAAEYIRKKRYHVIATGFRCRYGEIDLIAQNNRYLLFIEVKLRRSNRFAEAKEFVDAHKQERLRTTASVYLDQFPTELQPRFDVIEIYAPEGTLTKKPQIIHLEDAF